MTPIFIGEENVPENLRFLIRYNPMAGIVRAYRDRLLSWDWPAANELLLLTGWAVTVFVLGGLFFRHLKRGFADVL